MRLASILLFPLLLAAFAAPAAQAATRDAAVDYAISVGDASAQVAQVEARFPVSAAGIAAGEAILYLPVWTPGYYVREDYRKDVAALRAFDGSGRELAVEDAGANRWRVDGVGEGELVVRYALSATGRSVSRNEITGRYAVFNGSATYIAAKGSERLAQRVALSLPEGWSSATGLAAAGPGAPHRYVADGYEELVDSPIMAGDLQVLEFESRGTPHYLVYNRGAVDVDDRRAVADLKAMADQTRAFWGAEPWRKYVFLVAFRESGGGLEHRHSTFVNVNPARFATPKGYRAFVSLLAHEYQHAFNVKRLRPLELGPFDYEGTPTVSTLWIAEGLTSYYSNLMLRRSGLIDRDAYLAVLSAQVTALQNSPGRLLQSLEQSSMEVWSNSNSGVGASAGTVSYYIKGEVAGFLLDAHVRKASGGRHSLDDAMRAAYAKYSGDVGFRPEQFAAVVAGVAGTPVDDWFASVVGSAGELDYAEALDWYGLRLDQVEGDDGKVQWKISVSDSADADQRRRLADWIGPA